MRTIRRLATGLALTALLPAAASAQLRTPFDNSWYWGAKGGLMTARTTLESIAAPIVGVDWLITRSRGGLYMSFDQGFFDDMRATVPDMSQASGMREVRIKNIRRVSGMLMAFPGTSPFLRPYAGAGVSLNMIQRANALGTYSSPDEAESIEELVEDRRTRTALTIMAGLQAQYTRVAIFGQASVMPTGSHYLLNGDDQTWLIEGGLRFNVGSAIERLK